MSTVKLKARPIVRVQGLRYDLILVASYLYNSVATYTIIVVRVASVEKLLTYMYAPGNIMPHYSLYGEDRGLLGELTL